MTTFHDPRFPAPDQGPGPFPGQTWNPATDRWEMPDGRHWTGRGWATEAQTPTVIDPPTGWRAELARPVARVLAAVLALALVGLVAALVVVLTRDDASATNSSGYTESEQTYLDALHGHGLFTHNLDGSDDAMLAMGYQGCRDMRTDDAATAAEEIAATYQRNQTAGDGTLSLADSRVLVNATVDNLCPTVFRDK